MLVALSEKKFGKWFYASPAAIDQYEETTASLVGFQRLSKKGNFTWKPKVYWRRNRRICFIRKNPSIYRNLHISNKIAAELNGSYIKYWCYRLWYRNG
jgi:iron complex outermembrane receptor protein